MNKKILLIPRFVKEGQRNGNGFILEPKSLNKELNEYINSKSTNFIFSSQLDLYGDKDELFINDLQRVIGRIIGFDENNIQICVDEDFLEKYKTPVALIDAVGSINKSRTYEVYKVIRVVVRDLNDMNNDSIRYYNTIVGGIKNEK